MSDRFLRAALSLVDVAGVPIFIGWFIWRGQFFAPRAWLWVVAWIVASFLIHRDTPKTLGMRADNLWPATKQAAIVFSAFALALFLIGVFLGQPLHPPPNYRSFGRLWNYLAFCLVQQTTLNSLLTNRLLSLGKRRWLASFIAGTIFSALHWPNPVLVPLTLVAGIAMTWMFARVRNILPLAAGQALLGSLVWWAFPIAWHHMLRVGPGYYAPY
jgi:Type II CAAX prenyl endopeptidase Rce1-like